MDLQSLTRVEKKAARKAERENDRFDNLLDVGNVGDLDALVDMRRQQDDSHDDFGESTQGRSSGTRGGGKALRRSLSAFRK
jgi:hypothetical protein